MENKDKPKTRYEADPEDDKPPVERSSGYPSEQLKPKPNEDPRSEDSDTSPSEVDPTGEAEEAEPREYRVGDAVASADLARAIERDADIEDPNQPRASEHYVYRDADFERDGYF